MKFYRVTSEAYFRPSDFFVNGRDHIREGSPYPLEKANVGGRRVEWLNGSAGSVVEKLRMGVDIVAESRSDGIH